MAGSISRRPDSPMARAERRPAGGQTRRPQTAKATKPAYAFRLFVAGSEPNSMEARQNLARLCETHLKGRHRIEIVDVFKSASDALKHRVVVTPTLMVIEPRPGVTLLGNLSDTRQVLFTLRLNGYAR